MASAPAAIVLVVAAADNGVIGRGGTLPWRMPSDMRTFRRLTIDKPVIMGRRTFQSLKSPLKERDNIVVTRDAGFQADGAIVVHDIAAALATAQACASQRGVAEIAVIGGAEIYGQVLGRATRIYLTRIHGAPAGDTLLPTLAADEWQETSRETLARDQRDEYAATLVTLERRPAPTA